MTVALLGSRDVLSSAPSLCIFPNKFSLVYKNRKNIENRHYVVNMKAIGAVVMTESAITFRKPGPRPVDLYCSIE